MNQKIFLAIIFITTLTGLKMSACPFTITNDSTTQILVVDPNGWQAVRIAPQQTQVINPTLSWDISWEWWYWIRLYSEKLKIYLKHEKVDTFYLAYELTEKYCVTDFKTKNRLSLSNIKELSKKPTDRLEVKVFEKPKHAAHGTHKH